MNQRYHQRKTHDYWWRDTAAKIATAGLAVAGFGLAITSATTTSIVLDVVGILVSFAAALVAIALNVLPFGAREKEHLDGFRRWTDLREEVDGLLYDLGNGEPPDELSERLRELDAKKQRICGSETLADTDLLDECQTAEENSRGCAPCEPEAATVA